MYKSTAKRVKIEKFTSTDLAALLAILACLASSRQRHCYVSGGVTQRVTRERSALPLKDYYAEGRKG
jgi:hypothetical protein